MTPPTPSPQPPTPDSVVTDLTAQLAALPSRRTDDVRTLRRAFSAQLKKADPAFVLAVADRLLDRSIAEDQFLYRFIAYELIAAHPAALRSLGPDDLERLGRGLDRWEAVDTFAPYLAGPAWRMGQVPDSLIAAWAASPDRWWRRAALVSTVGLNIAARGGTGDTARTLAICDLLVGDRDDMVVKALSWALRALARWDPAAVRGFLAAHAGQVAPRVVREVNNKLRTGLKNPKLRREA
jgi:3-methyladenine DNA glycosylase AlkD